MNKSVMKCCICNNENIGQFITINNKKYHLCCIENLQQENKKLTGAIQTYDILLKANTEENKKLKDNQIRAMNKIRDFIDAANCEIKESKYSNDKHGLYWELFRKDLTNIQKLIKGINTDEYVNIPKYREKELLNLEDNWNKLKEWLKEYEEGTYGLGSYETGISDGLGDVIKKMQELEQGSDSNE